MDENGVNQELSKLEYVVRGWRPPQGRKDGVYSRRLLHGNLNLGEESMARRTFLAQIAGLPFLALGMKPQDSKNL